MNKSVEFHSKAFPARPGEDEEVNPGRYGKALAEYLSAELQARGVPVAAVSAEDWGWRIDIQNADFPLWIGCGNLDGEADGFLCFVEPSKPKVGWFNRKDTTAATEHLASEVYAILSANSQVKGLRPSD